MFRHGPLSLLELTLPTAAANVACDEVLLRQVEETDGEPILRLWEPDSYAVVLGRANRIDRNVDVDACRRDGVPIVRRCSGGGTVLLGPGSLVFSLVLRLESQRNIVDVGRATQIVLDRVLVPLRECRMALERKGTSDLAVDDVKVSGNSQRWLRTTVLHHGTLLYDFDLERVGRYLTRPEREPDYRQGRPHADFLTNLPIDRATLCRLLIDAWDASPPAPVVPLDRIEELVRSRYANDDWTNRLNANSPAAVSQSGETPG